MCCLAIVVHDESFGTLLPRIDRCLSHPQGEKDNHHSDYEVKRISSHLIPVCQRLRSGSVDQRGGDPSGLTAVVGADSSPLAAGADNTEPVS